MNHRISLGKLKNKNRWRLSLLLLSFLFSFQVNAQRTLIEVSLDSAAILIGEQTCLHYTVTTDRDKAVQIVLPQDTLMAGVEVLLLSKPDSSIIENDRLLIKQDILITSFDSSLYLLPPLKVIDGTDTISSRQLALKVSTVPVNADKPEEFNDIKEIWEPPFVLADYYPLIFGILFGLLLLCVIAYVIRRLRNHQSLMPFAKPEPPLPPHEQAVKELDAIREQKLWQQGLNKEFYTLITDTLRRYIDERFLLNAMELTSLEILDALKRNEDVKPVYHNLKQMLELADFVKFAKMHPLPDENEQMLTQAYLFVDNTKVVEEIVEEEQGGTEEEPNTKGDDLQANGTKFNLQNN